MVDGDLGERVGILEDLIGAPAHEAGTLSEQAELHSARIVEIHKLISDNQKDMVDRYHDCLQQLLAIAERVEVRFSAIENDIALLKATAVGASSSARGGEGSKLKVPEPKQFGGSRNAKELENFLWDMEQYFRAARVVEKDQVTITSMYLEGDAKLWWRTRLDDDASAGRPRIETWETLKKELRDQFLPLNTAWVAREALKKLKHTGTVRDYVKEFSSLMLDVKNMSEDDKLFNFFSGLQPWAQAELRRQNVKDLPTAIAAADSLVDYKINPSSTSADKKKGGDGKNKKGKEHKKGKNKKTGDSSKQRGSDPPQSQGNANSGCFLCNGNHKIRDCPKRNRLTALVTDDEPSGSGDSGDCAPRVNPIQLLNAITVESKAPPKGLMYVTVTVNGRQVRAMLDTGATNNFVSQAMVDHLGLQVSKSPNQVKAVNSRAQNIQGTTTSVLKMGKWQQECRFMALPLDDFDLILGVEFFVQAKAIAMPHLGGLLIADEFCPSFIPVEHGQVTEKPLWQSASQVKTGIKRGETTMIAALVEVKPDQVVEVPDQVAAVLDDYSDVMPAELPRVLPPRRAIDHRIELEPGARPPARGPYRMAPLELAELRKQLGELLAAGYIQPSKAPYGAPVLFQRKQDGTLRMCVDYRALNKITVKNKYPVPNVADLFDRLSKAAFFTKLDLRSGYWQVRIAEGDEAKTACVTRYGSFEFLVMPFGLTNAPATFCNLMNDVLYEFLDHFVVVYLDDIVVYSPTLADHVEHLKLVFSALRRNSLYVRKEKCEFCQQEIMFLGHKVSKGQIRMDERKVQAILEWAAPTKVSELRSFLGLANYYRRFIEGYSKKASPLSDLLKKDKQWEWTQDCQDAFDGIKCAVTSEPVLRLPDFELPFEVHTDASDRAIGGVLVQEGHPIAFESRKLKEAEQRYSAHEKEMAAVVHCLEIWRHYLLGTRFVVVTDNVANTYFKTQKKLTPKQARWQEFLAEFDFNWLHRPGSQNQVADALSRKEVKTFVASLTTVQSDFLDRVKNQALADKTYEQLRQRVKEGLVRKYFIEGDLLYARGSRLYVPAGGGLRRELLRETHDPQWAGHPGVERMVALLSRTYFWPRMEDDIEMYVRTCRTCQIDKTERKKQAGLLQPLPIPERQWESVSMDFISGFPTVDGLRSVLVVVDRFSKFAVFVGAPHACTAEAAAELFFKHVVKLFGVPKDIVSDRDARFTGKFWTFLFKLMGSDLKFSTANHPQTDGQTERINALLEEYLRHYVTASQRNWVSLLDTAQFCYNIHKSSSTGLSPAELVMGHQPLTPLDVAKMKSQGECPAAYRFARDKQELIEQARESLAKAQRRMEKYANQHRRPLEFQVGDRVLLKLTPQIWKKVTDKRFHKGLVQRYDGPFVVIKRVGNVAYRLQLPERMKIHPTFHVSFLKPYFEDVDQDRQHVRRAPPNVRKHFEKQVVKILDHRTMGASRKNRRTDYLVQWEGSSEVDATWERDVTLWQFEDQIKEYLETLPTRTSASSGGGGFVRPS